MVYVDNKLLKGPIFSTIIIKAVPIAFGISALAISGFIDVLFVGQLGVSALAAVAVSMPLLMISGSFYSGLAEGSQALFARAIGAGDTHYIKKIFAVALILVTILSASNAILFRSASANVLSLMGISGVAGDMAVSYLQISLFGQIPVGLTYLGTSILKSTGDTLTASTAFIIAAVVNVVFDFLLVPGSFGFPAMGIQGAALASVIAWSACCIFVYWKVINLSLIDLTLLLKMSFGSVFRLLKTFSLYGLPVSIIRILLPLSTAVVFGLVARCGEDFVAVFVVAGRIEAVFMLFSAAVSVVLGLFVAQNLGAGQPIRARKAIRQVFQFCICYGFSLCLLFAFFGPLVWQIVSAQVNTGQQFRVVLVALASGLAGRMYIMMLSSVAAAVGLPLDGAILSLVHAFAITVPFYFLGVTLGQQTGILLAMPLVGLAGFPLGFLWFRLRCVDILNTS